MLHSLIFGGFHPYHPSVKGLAIGIYVIALKVFKNQFYGIYFAYYLCIFLCSAVVDDGEQNGVACSPPETL